MKLWIMVLVLLAAGHAQVRIGSGGAVRVGAVAGSGSGTTITANGGAVASTVDLSSTTPVAESNYINVKFQYAAGSLSAEVPTGSTSGTLALGNHDHNAAYVSLSGSYSNPTWITGLAWSKIGTPPTTLGGYGITDALASSTVLPANTTSTTHQFFTAYNSTTGGFTKAQPACGDISDAGTVCTHAATEFMAATRQLAQSKSAVTGEPLLGFDAVTGLFMQGALTATDIGLGAVTNDAQTKAAVMPNTAPSAGQIPVGNVGNTAYAPQTVSGAITMTSAGVTALAAPYTKRSCEIVINGSGAANVLQSGDDTDAANSCFNKLGVTETIVGVYCRSTASSNTTTIHPVFGAAGSGTTILSGALTCGSSNAYSTMATGCGGGACTISNGALVDGAGINPVMGGTLTGTSIHVLIVYTVPAS